MDSEIKTISNLDYWGYMIKPTHFSDEPVCDSTNKASKKLPNKASNKTDGEVKVLKKKGLKKTNFLHFLRKQQAETAKKLTL